MLHCSKSKVHLCPCALHLYYSMASAPSLSWARQGTWALSCVSDSRTKLGLINRTKAALQILVHPPLVPEHWAQQVPPFKNPLGGTCPSVRPVGVWQHSQKLSGDGRQTAWLDVKSLRKETELDSWPGHALVSVLLPLLLVFLIMLVWFVSLSSLELASQLIPQCDHHLPSLHSLFLYLER